MSNFLFFCVDVFGGADAQFLIFLQVPNFLFLVQMPEHKPYIESWSAGGHIVAPRYILA